MLGLGLGLGLSGLFIFLISLAGFLLWIFALIDACKSDFSGNNKIIWILIIIFIPLIGPVLYLAVGKGQRIQDLSQPNRAINLQTSAHNICLKCNTKNDAIAQFCTECGGKIT
jgi:multisubunit Na+/H+ antiporter MnhG subunit